MTQLANKECIAGADRILSNGYRIISNKQVFVILAIVRAPQNVYTKHAAGAVLLGEEE